jgi:hypothetical protein
MFSRTARLSMTSTSRVSQISSHLQQQQRKMTTCKLNTGATIPAVGFGTWQDKASFRTDFMFYSTRHESASGSFYYLNSLSLVETPIFERH